MIDGVHDIGSIGTASIQRSQSFVGNLPAKPHGGCGCRRCLQRLSGIGGQKRAGESGELTACSGNPVHHGMAVADTEGTDTVCHDINGACYNRYGLCLPGKLPGKGSRLLQIFFRDFIGGSCVHPLFLLPVFGESADLRKIAPDYRKADFL